MREIHILGPSLGQCGKTRKWLENKTAGCICDAYIVRFVDAEGEEVSPGVFA